jgi:hypothetical protein
MANTLEGLQRKSGLAPTGVLRQMPVHSSYSDIHYTPVKGERQTGASCAAKADGWAGSRALLPIYKIIVQAGDLPATILCEPAFGGEVSPPSTWPNFGRSLAYVASALSASLFYCAWIFCELLVSNRGSHEQFIGLLSASIFASISFLLFGGFGLVFLALTLPWAVTVRVFPKGRWSGKPYFTFVGAILVLVLGCLISSAMPKPLFIEDQTFTEGVLIAAKRQGICFALAGSVFGASYWFLSERHVRADKTPGPSFGG